MIDMSSTVAETQETPIFRLYRYNPRRRARGAEAAQVEIDWGEGDCEYYWMSESDIRDNIKEFGDSDGLRDALEAYRENVKV